MVLPLRVYQWTQGMEAAVLIPVQDLQDSDQSHSAPLAMLETSGTVSTVWLRGSLCSLPSTRVPYLCRQQVQALYVYTAPFFYDESADLDLTSFSLHLYIRTS